MCPSYNSVSPTSQGTPAIILDKALRIRNENQGTFHTNGHVCLVDKPSTDVSYEIL